MLDDILEFILEVIFSSLPAKIVSWIFSIIFIIMGIYLYNNDQTNTAYWILAIGVLFAIIALLITVFARRR